MNGYRRYQYYVEGECEKKLIEVFKKAGPIILPGNINVFNVKQNIFTSARLANLASNTVVILVFDTEPEDTSILKRNIELLRKSRNVSDIWCIMQVKNFEDELIRATDVKEIRELIGCKSNSDFKREWIREKRLMEKLKSHNFDYDIFWSTSPNIGYDGIENNSYKVKII